MSRLSKLACTNLICNMEENYNVIYSEKDANMVYDLKINTWQDMKIFKTIKKYKCFAYKILCGSIYKLK
jgi:hypothetical protein